jgi:bifunctional DNA-binding transcriptional regulator/antitoxin component of YhaV-PrlF toxin-antitoxin module
MFDFFVKSITIEHVMELKISAKGWVIISAKLRKKYSLDPGDTVQIVDYGNVMAIVPSFKNPIEEAAGLLEGGNSFSQVLLEERKVERSREKRKVK